MTREIPLLRHLIDYAGLFPPAALPFDAAVQNYHAYVQSEASWLLGCFVCPVARLHELFAYRERFSSAAPCPLSVLTGAETGPGGARSVPLASFEQLATFLRDAEGLFDVRSLEVRLPVDRNNGRGPQLRDWATSVAASAVEAGVNDPVIFVEIPVNEMAPDAMDAVAMELAAAADALDSVQIAAKVRCGGATADDIPNVPTLAHFLRTVAHHHLPWKATAGLHHPFRAKIAGTAEVQHGFVNLFAASTFLHVGRIAPGDIESVLSEEDGDAFDVTPNGVAWRGVSASASEVTAARRHFALGFGSCSFDEPLDDLRRAGILNGHEV